ncbi:putative dead deah box helicase [Erysiphe necator]|uniref:Putative dead deah box helicase n=1 Tax=Uncinula necator TaxID=52586 RepID=A0A0B1P9V0_UNCNE|nr:putative dead deah box helicase [Erysiphe necator]
MTEIRNECRQKPQITGFNRKRKRKNDSGDSTLVVHTKEVIKSTPSSLSLLPQLSNDDDDDGTNANYHKPNKIQATGPQNGLDFNEEQNNLSIKTKNQQIEKLSKSSKKKIEGDLDPELTKITSNDTFGTSQINTSVTSSDESKSVTKEIILPSPQPPWPEFFQRLEKTHQALNLVFTFCCTRKRLATKFDTIKSAVEAHINHPLEIQEVAQIVALRPTGIKFTYVDEAMLQVDLVMLAQQDNESENLKNQRGNFFPSNTASDRPDIYQINNMRAVSKTEDKKEEVLFFEFIDGDLKRQAKSYTKEKTGDPAKTFRRLRKKDENLKMPTYSKKQMLGLISKRNCKFKTAVEKFLGKCYFEGKDPVETLKKEALLHTPIPSQSNHTSRRSSSGRGEELISGNNNTSLSTIIIPAIPTDRKSIPEIITELKESDIYTGQIVPDGHRVFDPQEAIYGNLNFLLSQNLVNALYNSKNITKFYAHQAEAMNNLHDGYHVIVATSTSSGKSLIYQVPVLHELECDRNTRALYIFPTKALAQDQKRSLKEMISYMRGLEEVMIETFDGDTEMIYRNRIRDEGRIIFTNPDMLHITILPQEERWRSFLKNLKFVVVDEIHVYNGLFGSHVALIMRRLRRICAALGNHHLKFISCSATVANPLEHFKTIFGVDNVKITDFDGSPSGRKEFLCWNTPFKDPGDPASGRGDITTEVAKLFCQLILRGARVIAFCKVRKGCEALVGAIKHELKDLGRPECMSRVMGYRGGYTPQDRRQIERQMFEGKLMGIIATTALELGVDIGSLDAVITVGFPYSIANLRQQSGRAGRRNKDSLSILVGDSFPTDQHYMQNPDEIFTKPNSKLQVDLQNMLVLEGHIQCAAHEMPIRIDEDVIYFSKFLREIAEERLVKDELGFYHCHDRFLPTPSKFISIRDTEEDHFAIIDITHGKNIVLEELEASRAFFTLYDGGIFLHQGNSYLVKEFNPDQKIAKVELVRVDWTTQQRNYTDIDPVETEAIRLIPGSLSRAFYGKIKIQKTVYGFFKVDKKRRVLDAVQVDNPPIIQFSKGMWLDVPKQALDLLASRRLCIAGAIHAAEHAILSLVPNFVISMPGDVRTECKVGLKEFVVAKARKNRREEYSPRKRPARLTFYDTKGGVGGSGLSTKAFEFIHLLLQQAVKRIDCCHCLEGCVECVASEYCKHANEIMSKAGALVILKTFLNMPIDIDALPLGPEEGVENYSHFTVSGSSTVTAAAETIVLAEPILPKGRVKILDYCES